MKTLLLTTSFVLASILCFAQQWSGTTSTATGNAYRTGSVSIGTSSAYNGSELTIQQSGDPVITMLRGTTLGKLQMGVTGCVGCYTQQNSSSNDAFIRNSYTGTSKGNFIISNQAFGDILFTAGNYQYDSETMRIYSSGKVRIGNVATPGTYKLYVDDGILTEKVKVAVATSSKWADFVFAPRYNLLPLEEVELFVQKNQHLPDVPSAAEVVKNGIDLGEMDAILLQKIEELTLYMIDSNKKIEELNTEIKRLKK